MRVRWSASGFAGGYHKPLENCLRNPLIRLMERKILAARWIAARRRAPETQATRRTLA